SRIAEQHDRLPAGDALSSLIQRQRQQFRRAVVECAERDVLIGRESDGGQLERLRSLREVGQQLFQSGCESAHPDQAGYVVFVPGLNDVTVGEHGPFGGQKAGTHELDLVNAPVAVNAQIDIAVGADRAFGPARLLEFDLAARPRIDEDVSAINQADALPITVDDLLGEGERTANVAGLVARLLQGRAEFVYLAARGAHRLLQFVDRLVI